jgi:hypothetical protein
MFRLERQLTAQNEKVGKSPPYTGFYWLSWFAQDEKVGESPPCTSFYSF